MFHKAIFLVPVDLADKADALGAALGYALPGDKVFTRPYPTGEAPTHMAAHARVKDDFLLMLAGARAGSLPPVDWAAYGLTPEDVTAISTAMIASAPGSVLDPAGTPFGNTQDHFAAALAAAGLPPAP